MLQRLYLEFGFMGALALSVLLFAFSIFWIAGLAGIALPMDGGKAKQNRWELIIAILFPLYPIGWLLVDIYKQHKFMKYGK